MPDLMARFRDSLPPILTAPQIARVLRKDQRTIRRWIDRKLLPGWVTPTGRYLAYRDELRDWGWFD